VSLTSDALAAAEERGQPRTFSPMLATLTDERFSNPDWIFERKFDGERCLAWRDSGKLRLLSRNQKVINNSYPELVEALKEQSPSSFIVDGEIVAFEGHITSFSRLQSRMQIDSPERARRTGVAVYYYLFDIVHFEGRDLSSIPLRQRKALLRDAFTFKDPIRFTAHRNARGEEYFRKACAKGWEGIIAKRADSSYEQKRSRRWLKFKCVAEQEFVIGGFTEPKGGRQGFGALLLGFHRDGELVYAGKVGTGFDEQTLKQLRESLNTLERKTSAFAGEEPLGDKAHWVSPKLVCQVAFTEWTKDGKLRHPRYLGLRRDKDPGDVVRESTAG
jgi:bifunctional non-homologous end joining protein LigD